MTQTVDHERWTDDNDEEWSDLEDSESKTTEIAPTPNLPKWSDHKHNGHDQWLTKVEDIKTRVVGDLSKGDARDQTKIPNHWEDPGSDQDENPGWFLVDRD